VKLLYSLGLGALVAALLSRLHRARVSINNGIMAGPGDVRYRITPTDLLWTKRMLAGEVGESPPERSAAACLWAMTNYHMLVIGPRGARPKFSTFTELLRAYSQPINSAWDSASDSKCQAYPSSCTPERLARRARITRMTLFSSVIERVVSEWYAGRLANPVPGLTDWHARHWEGATVEVGGNWFGVGSTRRLA